MSTIDTKSILAMRAQILERNASVFAPKTAAGATEKPSFTAVFERAAEAVNKTQQESSTISAAFERGETADLAAVMMARQKSSLAFQTTLQVRNKLLSAYKDIMSMPV